LFFYFCFCYSVPGGPLLGEYTDKEAQQIIENFDEMPLGSITIFSHYRDDEIVITNPNKPDMPSMIVVKKSDGESADRFVRHLMHD